MLITSAYTLIYIPTLIDEEPKIFSTDYQNLHFIVSDIMDKVSIEDNVDYIIRCASATDSKSFVDRPVDVSMTLLYGTINMLNLAREKRVKGFVYLSSMEVYGHLETDELIKENHSCNIDTMNARSCYPEGKRMCESLCYSYYKQFGVPTTVACLTQTLSSHVGANDHRFLLN